MRPYPFKGRVAGFEPRVGLRKAVALATHSAGKGALRSHRVIWLDQNSTIRRPGQDDLYPLKEVQIGDELRGQVFRAEDGREWLLSATATFSGGPAVDQPSPKGTSETVSESRHWQCSECGQPDLTESSGTGYCPTCMRDVAVISAIPARRQVEIETAASDPVVSTVAEAAIVRRSGKKRKPKDPGLVKVGFGCFNLILVIGVLIFIVGCFVGGIGWVLGILASLLKRLTGT